MTADSVTDAAVGIDMVISLQEGIVLGVGC